MTNLLVVHKPGTKLRAWLIPISRKHPSPPDWLTDRPAWKYYKGWFVVESDLNDCGYEMYPPSRFHELFDLVTGPAGNPS